MGPARWRSFTDLPLLGNGTPAPLIPTPVPATPGVPLLQLLPGILNPFAQTAQAITAQQAAARQASAVLKSQTQIELARIAAESERSKSQALALAAGKELPELRGKGAGKLPAWVIPVALGGAALFLLSGLFRRRRK